MSLFERRFVARYPAGDPTDEISVEEPLEIRVEGRPTAITLRTPGHDLELAAGFLYSEGVIEAFHDLAAIAHIAQAQDPRANTVDTRLHGGVEAHHIAIERTTRERFANSSCGVCGKTSIDRLLIGAPPIANPRLPDPTVLLSLPERLREAQATFSRTGGLHAAALFSFEGDLEVLREDVGRHNAVDKVLGWRLLQNRAPIDDRILLVSGRAGFEIVQKALVARIPVVAAIGAPSTMAVDLAVASGMALIGFLRDGRYNHYNGGPVPAE